MRTILALAGTLFCLALTPAALAQETVSVTDDLGRVVQVPAHPTRIASLDDLRLSVPLIELGAFPIASHGRISDNGPYIRASKILTGVDFDNSGIIFLGNDLDLEALAKAEPDLIVTLAGRDSPIEQLEKIAPTLVFDPAVSDYLGIYDRLAELTGTQDKLDFLETRYATQLTQLQRLIDAPATTVSVISGADGNIAVSHTFGSLGIVLRDAGFAFPAAYADLAEGAEAELSPEYLPQLDADIIFDSFRADRNETPADADLRMRAVLETYCDALWACANGQYVVVPREEIYAISYEGLSTAVNMITALMSARPLQHNPAL